MKIDAQSLVALLTVGAQLTQTISGLITEAKGELSSDDEAALQAQLAELRAANDAAYDALQAKLAAAALR